mgnify:CR=1 FL=1
MISPVEVGWLLEHGSSYADAEVPLTNMVAERIVVTSRRAGSDQVWVWSSSGGSGFEIAPADEAAFFLARGGAEALAGRTAGGRRREPQLRACQDALAELLTLQCNEISEVQMSQ